MTVEMRFITPEGTNTDTKVLQYRQIVSGAPHLSWPGVPDLYWSPWISVKTVVVPREVFAAARDEARNGNTHLPPRY